VVGSGLAAGAHTLKIVSPGRKAASSGNVSGGRDRRPPAALASTHRSAVGSLTFRVRLEDHRRELKLGATQLQYSTSSSDESAVAGQTSPWSTAQRAGR